MFSNEFFKFFRNELASCLEKSFETIDLVSAAKLLLLAPEQIPQLVSFANQVLNILGFCWFLFLLERLEY